MILTDKQAHLLLHLLQDTLTKNVVGYLSTTHEQRNDLLNDILNQQEDVEPLNILEFETVAEGDGRSFVVAFPIDKIEKIESQVGSQNVFLKVNGIEVKGSYLDLIKKLGMEE